MVANKQPVKKTTVKKAAPKKTVATKAPAKKPVVKKTVAKKSSAKRVSKPAKMQSFRVYKDTNTFNKVSFTRQTIYWTLFLAVVMVTQLWILKIQLDIADLTNAILSTQL